MGVVGAGGGVGGTVNVDGGAEDAAAAAVGCDDDGDGARPCGRSLQKKSMKKMTMTMHGSSKRLHSFAAVAAVVVEGRVDLCKRVR